MVSVELIGELGVDNRMAALKGFVFSVSFSMGYWKFSV
jgi:hypothetical protein